MVDILTIYHIVLTTYQNIDDLLFPFCYTTHKERGTIDNENKCRTR